MVSRSKSQIIGEIGEYLTCYEILKSRSWIARMQQFDYGIDIEAELMETGSHGHTVKVQVKSSDHLNVNDLRYVKIRLEKSYLLQYESYALPVILVVVDLLNERCYYLYLQEWIALNSSRLSVSLPATEVVEIPKVNTIESGLSGEWKHIAKKETDFQYRKLLFEVEQMINLQEHQSMAKAFRELLNNRIESGRSLVLTTIGDIVDKVVGLGLEIRGTEDGWEVSQILFRICREFGEYFTKDHIFKIVVLKDTYSRVGLSALELLYDNYFSHTSSLRLPDAFIDYFDIQYYCRLRERYPGVTGIVMACANPMEYDWNIDGYGLSYKTLDILPNKYANRGPMAFLHYLQKLE
ncbi:MAG: DUF4365 domain-containing protein [Candidatus Cohnella colombiensis]|uniref:DUF4365 domain-containing protein n=1 Tax=Candidatus Cohnella colombiensis TaxID=3121368 RepID=A0AA95JES5_9BACL|nr:MAG: DUF4365 domain-containing protein [Cohnella sp.]